ncbi:hypothetical protein ALC60_07854 [Trachymyrmex zeteki]|uniref:Uncharacterized protein n=1 Tax=Mycetomoellerius zeteki TaxID=64791 RepID=A0A151WZ14_9HYME|nr:hypothetical protein ALC60_07854 [Trachymyrmex zeteki]
MGDSFISGAPTEVLRHYASPHYEMLVPFPATVSLGSHLFLLLILLPLSSRDTVIYYSILRYHEFPGDVILIVCHAVTTHGRRIGTGEDRRGAFAEGGKEGGVKRATDGTPMSATRTSSCGGTSRASGTAILDAVDIYPIFRLRWVCVLDGSLLSEEEDSVAGCETATDI